MPTSPVPPEEKFSDSSQMKDRAHCGLRWPETREDAGVLMISDDEDEV